MTYLFKRDGGLETTSHRIEEFNSASGPDAALEFALKQWGPGKLFPEYCPSEQQTNPEKREMLFRSASRPRVRREIIEVGDKTPIVPHGLSFK